MNAKRTTEEFTYRIRSFFGSFTKNASYHSGNVGHFLGNIFHVIFRIKVKILGVLMLGAPALYFDEGQEIILNLAPSIVSEGFIDIFVLFASGSIIVTWCSIALYLIIFK